MTARKLASARIWTLSPEEWNRHRQKAIAKRNESAAETPHVEPPKGAVEDVASMCLSLFRLRSYHNDNVRQTDKIEEYLYRRLTRIFGEESEVKCT